MKAPYRDGIGFPAEEVKQWEISQTGITACLIGDPKYDEQTSKPQAGLMTLERTLQSAIDETSDAYAQFDKARAKFRSEVKNDVSAIEASSRKIAAEFSRIVVALVEIQRTYTSADFALAVENAERLAGALGKIQDLGQSKITFSVIDHTKE